MKREYIFRILLFAVVYVILTKAALLLALDGGHATVVWPGSGLALSLLLIHGNRMWPAIAIGAFTINFIISGSIPAALFMCVGNTLEALVAYNIIKRYDNFLLLFTKLKNTINFIVASLIGSVLSAAIGGLTIFVLFTKEFNYLETFSTWLLGNLTSCLLIVPIVLLLNKPNLLLLKNRKTYFSFILLTIVCYLIFLKNYDTDVIPKAFVYSLVIFPLGASLTQNRLSALLHVFIISLFAISGTLMGKGPFIYSELNNSLIILQSFTAILTIITLIVSVGIKEKEMIEDKLSILLEDKEVLISEIHHRVKNNLAIVSSLLFLERENLKNEELQEKMDQTQLRIKTIALVHDKLNIKSNIKTVEFSDYIKTLTEMIHRLHETTRIPVTLTLNIDKVDIVIEKAVPLGLILNELLTNSYKHAFDGKESGEIEINFVFKNEKYFLSVKDNGVGLKNKGANNSDSLGIKLINTLSDQINADLSVKSEKGTVYEFSFN